MLAFISSFLFVVLAEMGDKTQLLAIAFATKYPWKTVMAAVAAATAVNHLMAVIVGQWLTNYIPMDWIHIAASVAFIVFGLWTIRGDKITDDDQKSRYANAFWTVAVAFFLAEMGDKTQLATVALAAKFPAEALWVISGTTLGMMIADAPAVFISNKLAERLSMKLMRRIAAAVFAILAVAAWLGC